MKVNGTIKELFETNQVSASYRKRDVVVSTDEQYQQHILIEFNGDRCDILNSYKKGDEVEIDINLKGREWVNPQGETKYFNTIAGWRIKRIGNQSAVDQYQQQKEKEKQGEAGLETNIPNPAEDKDDLPF